MNHGNRARPSMRDERHDGDWSCGNSRFALVLPWCAWSPALRVCADEPRLNQVQVIGSHNSYHVAPYKTVLESDRRHGPRPGRVARLHPSPLVRAILAQGIRQVELDVYADPKGGLFAAPSARKILLGLGKEPGPDPNAERSAQEARPESAARARRRFPVDRPHLRRRPEANPRLVPGEPRPCPHPDPGRAQGRRDPRLADPPCALRSRGDRNGRRRDPLGVRQDRDSHAGPGSRPVRDPSRSDPRSGLAGS